MAVEYSLQVNRLVKRCDILVFDKQMQALLIVEVKAASVNLSQQVLEQALRYNIAFRAPYLLLSNGIRHYMLCLPPDGDTRILDEIPAYSDMEKTRP
jgi:type I site-specific restriction endonuclease